MKAPEMREMTVDELVVHHDTLIDQLVNLRMQLAMRQIDNPKQVTWLKREVARAKTIINQKKLGAVKGEQPDSKA